MSKEIDTIIDLYAKEGLVWEGDKFKKPVTKRKRKK